MQRCSAPAKSVSTDHHEAVVTTVAMTQNVDDIGGAIGEALDHLDLDRVIGDRVVAVKPNETWATADDTTAVTQGDTWPP
jgi:hypothetical protein